MKFNLAHKLPAISTTMITSNLYRDYNNEPILVGWAQYKIKCDPKLNVIMDCCLLHSIMRKIIRQKALLYVSKEG